MRILWEIRRSYWQRDKQETLLIELIRTMRIIGARILCDDAMALWSKRENSKEVLEGKRSARQWLAQPHPTLIYRQSNRYPLPNYPLLILLLLLLL